MNLKTYSQTSTSKGKRSINFEKLNKMSQPKFNPKILLDFKKEKTELATEVLQRKDEAADFINNFYKTDEQGISVNEFVASIESLSVVKEKIELLKSQYQS
mmetsp:Transcript_42923/g.41272  ORF Transcript_42923/g.41272 Transcript_42923/m.41272 type:complete len:101 (+) Transcript_42923:319-621(+)